jgi:hypothetical protein
MKTNIRFALCAFVLVLVVAMSAFAYEYPLSADAIRDAYFLATRPGHESAQFISPYTRTLPELKVGSYTSIITVETPYLQVAEQVRPKINYHAQDAVAEFYGKSADFRIQMDIYFWRAISDLVEVNLIQNDKEIIPRAVKRSSLYPMADEFYTGGSIGEHLEIECAPEKIDSSVVTIKLGLPDGRKAQTKFDLGELR